ncbi:hypothetical protein GGR58DRAFT_525228 [Xylaria digitata]|nr:hypothetical protein GGR58DRAFT_525228 [Xylaria digitata]
MASIEEPISDLLLRIPPELQISILSFTCSNSPMDLVNLARSCQALYGVFIANKSGVFWATIKRLEPEELAITTAHYHASMATWKPMESIKISAQNQYGIDYLDEFTYFCQNHLSTQRTKVHITPQRLTLGIITHIIKIHHAIHSIASCVAPEVIEYTFSLGDPSPVEIAKVSKCLYVFDLVMILFPNCPESKTSQEGAAFNMFWSCFVPWEGALAWELFDKLNETITSTHRTFLITNTYRGASLRLSSIIMHHVPPRKIRDTERNDEAGPDDL